MFAGMHWRNIGPFRAGRVVAVSGVPGNPNRFYFGGVGGGVWQTDNAGRSWTPIFDDQPIASIGAIAVAASDANVMYVGSGEADIRSSLTQGNGMYKSADAGKTWRRIGLADSRAIGRIDVNPNDANDLVVAALGHPYGPNAERGVFRSTNGGETWRKVLYRDANTGAITVARDPHHPRVIYAALLQTRRPPWSVYAPSKGPGTGLFKSVDGGDTWAPVRGGFPVTGVGRVGIAVAPTDSNRVYAIVDAKDGGLYRSDDAGAHWSYVDREARIWGRGWYFGDVVVDPADKNTVYVSNTSVYRSTNGGASFTAIKGAPGGDDYHQLWIDPAAKDRMILASDQGAVISVDGARTWSSWYNQPTAQMYHVALDDRFPFWAYGAEQDSGAVAIPSRSSHRGISAYDWFPISAGGESDNVAPDPVHPGVLYGGRVVREDLRTHTVRNVSPVSAKPGTWRNTWTLPLVFSPLDGHVLYAAHQVLFRTADGGATWRAISPDLTREHPGIPPNLDARAAVDFQQERRGVIYTIAPSPLRNGTIWAGTDDGVIQLTRDEGASWENVTPAGLSAWSKIGIIEASHFDASSAYAAVDRHRLDDMHPYVYRTRDGGRSWQNTVNGLPPDTFVNAVREDPHQRGLLYAATESGVFVSFNDGAQWQPLKLNLPYVSVRDLALQDDSLVIATFGRSFWILDDVAPLQQLAAHAEIGRARLFTPHAAYRITPNSDQGTPLPPEDAAGENPPDGAIIDYALDAAPNVVVLEILDRDGTVARRWSSSDRVTRVDPSKLDIPAFWVQPPSALSAQPGMHRFVWDLHYGSRAGEIGLEDDRLRGPWAPPGTYRVRLTVDGASSVEPLTVRLDPRESATASELDAQYAFAQSIEDLRIRVRAALKTASRARASRLRAIATALVQLEAAEQSAPFAPTPDQRIALEQQRSALERETRP